MNSNFFVKSYKDTQMIYVKSNEGISVKFLKSLLYKKYREIVDKLYSYNNRDINLALKNVRYMMIYKNKDRSSIIVDIETISGINFRSVFNDKIECLQCRYSKNLLEEIEPNCYNPF